MLYRKLGKTNEEVSLLGFGCMRFPQINGSIDKIKSSEMLHLAIQNGINYIDTAYPYHDGESEPFVGEFLEKNNLRDKVKLATKLPSWAIKTKDDMYKYLDEQLQRLRTDYIDFYLVHTLTKEFWSNLTQNGLFEFLDDIKKKGIVKHIGFSFHDDLDLFKEIVDSYEWEFTQIQYNYIDENYQAGKEGLLYAYDRGLGVIIMEPLRGGKLANNLSEDLLKEIKNNNIDKKPVELAFQFLYDKAEVGLVLSGMSTIDQVKDNIKIVNEMGEINSLTNNEKETIQRLCQLIKEKTVVRCTDCKYCMPCPVGVNIPVCFELLNNSAMFNDVNSMKRHYKFLINEKGEASRCVECRSCESACPQHIDIINKLKLVKETLEN